MSVRSEVIRIFKELVGSGKKITELPAVSTPLAGTELLEIVQGGVNKKVTASSLSSGGTGVQTVVAGTNVTVDDTDPQNPIVSAVGTGSVESVSVGDLSPLFTSNVADPTTTPSVTFSLSTQNANLVFAGPTNGAAAAPTFRSLVVADLPDLSGTYQPLDADLTAIAGLGFSATAFLKKTAANTWSLDTTTYLPNTLTSAFIFVGNGSNVATGVAMTGDISITNAGATAYAGTVPVNRGGTNITSYTVGDILYASGATALSKLAAVATGSVLGSAGTTTAPAYLAVSNGLTATASTLKWGGAITAATSITGAFALDFTQNVMSAFSMGGTWTATANNQFHANFTGTFTARATSGDNLIGYKFTPSLIMASTGQTAIGVHIDMPVVSGGTTPGIEPLRISYNNVIAFSFFNMGRFGLGASGGPFISTSTGTTAQTETIGSGSLLLVTGGAWNGANRAAMQLVCRLSTSAVAGQCGFDFTTSSGANTWSVSTGSNTFVYMRLSPKWNITGGTNTVIEFDISPTETAMTGVTHIGIRVNSTTAMNGLGVAAPTSHTHTISLAAASLLTSANITLTNLHHTVVVDSSGGNRTVTLPPVASCIDRIYCIKKSVSANVVTLDGDASETIDGATTYDLTALNSTVWIQAMSGGWMTLASQ